MKVVVAGAGIVGLTCAWWLAEAGHDVTVYDPSPGQGASYAAAGMIAPAGEAWFGEEPLLRLGVASAALWPGTAERLGVGFHRTGTLLVGRDADDVAVLRRQVTLLRSLGLPVTDRDEHVVSDRVAGTAFLPEDAYVDPREVMSVLCRVLGDRVIRQPAPPSPEDAVLVRCTGTAAHRLVRPIRGEIVRVRGADQLATVVRGLVHGVAVYLVPRPGDELLIGATSESHDAPPVPTVGGVLGLLDAARALVPSLDRAEIVEVLARDRPGTPDNGPLVGRIGEREVLAAGHYRGGVLLAPVTAAAVLALVEDREPPAEIAPFHPARFTPSPTPTQEAFQR
jgi:glycine oxidase